MLYDSFAFSKNGSPTLTELDGKTTWKAPEDLSTTDKEVIQKIYNK